MSLKLDLKSETLCLKAVSSYYKKAENKITYQLKYKWLQIAIQEWIRFHRSYPALKNFTATLNDLVYQHTIVRTQVKKQNYY